MLRLGLRHIRAPRTGADPYTVFKYSISFPQVKYIKFNINEKLYLKIMNDIQQKISEINVQKVAEEMDEKG